jgi:hypothetical protein
MEERILKYINDQVRDVMAVFQATTIKEIIDKLDSLEVRLAHEGSVSSSPRPGSTEGQGKPLYHRDQYMPRSHIQGPKQDFHVFSEKDPEEWVAQCEYIFKMYDIPEEQKMIQAVANFRGEAGSWYKGFKSNGEHSFLATSDQFSQGTIF